MSTHHHSVIFVVSKRLMTENAVSCFQNKKSFANDLVTWWMQIASHWIPPKFELNGASKTFEKLRNVMILMALPRFTIHVAFVSVQGLSGVPNFGASSASMWREGSGGGICDLGSRIWGARIWECPCESQLLRCRVWLSSSILAFFKTQIFHWQLKYFVSSGLTWSGKPV